MTAYEMARAKIKVERHSGVNRWYVNKNNRAIRISVARAARLLSKYGMTPAQFLQEARTYEDKVRAVEEGQMQLDDAKEDSGVSEQKSV